MFLSDKKAECENEIVQLFAEKFSSVYKNKNLKDLPILFKINESFNSIEVSEAEKYFASVNLHHCLVPDNLHLLIIIT